MTPRAMLAVVLAGWAFAVLPFVWGCDAYAAEPDALRGAWSVARGDETSTRGASRCPSALDELVQLEFENGAVTVAYRDGLREGVGAATWSGDFFDVEGLGPAPVWGLLCAPDVMVVTAGSERSSARGCFHMLQVVRGEPSPELGPFGDSTRSPRPLGSRDPRASVATSLVFESASDRITEHGESLLLGLLDGAALANGARTFRVEVEIDPARCRSMSVHDRRGFPGEPSPPG